MENRRENYRHSFAPEEALPVKMETLGNGKTFSGEIFSLSAGGAGVQIPQKDIPLAVHDRISVKFSIPGVDLPLVFRSIVCHTRTTPEGWFYGIKFLPSGDRLVDNQNDHVIWSFLLEMQRKSAKKKGRVVR